MSEAKFTPPPGLLKRMIERPDQRYFCTPSGAPFAEETPWVELDERGFLWENLGFCLSLISGSNGRERALNAVEAGHWVEVEIVRVGLFKWRRVQPRRLVF